MRIPRAGLPHVSTEQDFTKNSENKTKQWMGCVLALFSYHLACLDWVSNSLTFPLDLRVLAAWEPKPYFLCPHLAAHAPFFFPLSLFLHLFVYDPLIVEFSAVGIHFITSPAPHQMGSLLRFLPLFRDPSFLCYFYFLLFLPCLRLNGLWELRCNGGDGLCFL